MTKTKERTYQARLTEMTKALAAARILLRRIHTPGPTADVFVDGLKIICGNHQKAKRSLLERIDLLIGDEREI
jgi:hypothetical protein